VVQLTIHFKLLPDKLNEFTLSWESFCHHIKRTEGLSEYNFHQFGENNCDIVLLWKDQQCLNKFMQIDWYKFLLGAIDVLGDNKSITQKQLQEKTK
jgi:quinol monooxygenase YgiN